MTSSPDENASDDCRDSANWLDLAERLFATDSGSARPLEEGSLARTAAVEQGGRSVIVKCFELTIPQVVYGAPDTRVQTFSRMFPIPPFFSSLRSWHNAVSEAVSIDVPKILAEGKLTDGRHYVAMTRLSGHASTASDWRDPARQRSMSAAVGQILRELHAADLPADVAALPQDKWLDQAEEITHALGDVLANKAGNFSHAHKLHLRLHHLVEAMRNVPFGEPAIVHGDLHPVNLLFSDQGEISGLVDFGLTCCAPAAIDLRHLAAFDEDALLSSYGRYEGSLDQACWVGHFIDLIWNGLGFVCRHSGETTYQAIQRDATQFEYLLQLCEDKALRSGSSEQRRRQRETIEREVGQSVAPQAPIARTNCRVAMIVPTWNHCDTTTTLCLRALRWFTNIPYRVVFVDNDSHDGTRDLLAAAAATDPRIEVICASENLGWAGGTLAGLEHLKDSDSHVLLLNSDVIVTPNWLGKLLSHMSLSATDTFVIPDEYPAAAGALGPAAPEQPIGPGTELAPDPPPMADILRLSEIVERQNTGVAEPGHPSGFCMLFDRAQLDLVRQYLTDFERYHRGEIDAGELWANANLRCVVARDTYVFHARGGSGGYYRYNRVRAL
jgi:GT2 family glycosyltransferase